MINPGNAGHSGFGRGRIRATVTMPRHRHLRMAGSETSNLFMEQGRIGRDFRNHPESEVIRFVCLAAPVNGSAEAISG